MKVTNDCSYPQPRVDILLPVFNAAKYLVECLDSLFSQQYENYRVVVLDDASTDISPLILSVYQSVHPNLVIYRNEVNEGIIESRNKLFDLSDADYVALMDADDICHKDRLSLQVEFLESHSDHIAVGSWYEVFDARSSIGSPPERYNEVRAHLMITNAVCNSSAMVRRSYLLETGLRCDPTFRGSADYKFWLDCSQRHKLANLPKVLLRYRRHHHQESTANAERQRDAHFRILKDHWAQYGLAPVREEVNALIWQEEVSLSDVRSAAGWVMRVFNQWSLDDDEIRNLVLTHLDIRFRRCCNRHGVAGLITYVRHQGLKRLCKGKYFGFGFVRDCVRQSLRLRYARC